MYAKDEATVSKPVGDEQVVPMTRLKASLASKLAVVGFDLTGEQEGRWRNGEFDGVSLSRVEEAELIFAPLKWDERKTIRLSQFGW